MKAIVVAYDQNRGIGAENELLWLRDLPADLRHFKELTTGHSIIMGRRTFESIGRPLPNRHNIVVSRSLKSGDGYDVARSLNEAYELAVGDALIIGGGQIYDEALADSDIVYATEVAASFDAATVFFPELPQDFQEVSREHHKADDANKYAYDFVTYQRN